MFTNNVKTLYERMIEDDLIEVYVGACGYNALNDLGKGIVRIENICSTMEKACERLCDIISNRDYIQRKRYSEDVLFHVKDGKYPSEHIIDLIKKDYTENPPEMYFRYVAKTRLDDMKKVRDILVGVLYRGNNKATKLDYERNVGCDWKLV